MAQAKVTKVGGKDFVKKIPPPLALPPTTTEQEDVTTAGQRRVNLIWEFTQATIAIMITSAVVYNAATGREITKDLSNAFFLIVSMYFVRTNHSLIGGIGKKTGTR